VTDRPSRDPGYERYQAFIDEAKQQSSKWLEQRLKRMEDEIEEIVARKIERALSQRPLDSAARSTPAQMPLPPSSPALYVDAWWKLLILAATIIVLTVLGTKFFGSDVRPIGPQTKPTERAPGNAGTEESLLPDEREPDIQRVVRDIRADVDALPTRLRVARLPTSVQTLADKYASAGRPLGGPEELRLIDGLTQALLNDAGTTPALKVDGQISWKHGSPVGRSGPVLLDYLSGEYLPRKRLKVRDAIAAVEMELGTGREDTIKFLQRAVVSEYLISR